MSEPVSPCVRRADTAASASTWPTISPVLALQRSIITRPRLRHRQPDSTVTLTERSLCCAMCHVHPYAKPFLACAAQRRGALPGPGSYHQQDTGFINQISAGQKSKKGYTMRPRTNVWNSGDQVIHITLSICAHGSSVHNIHAHARYLVQGVTVQRSLVLVSGPYCVDYYLYVSNLPMCV